MSKIQRVELNKFYDVAIYCPFCGSRVVNDHSDLSEPTVRPCPHTLFVAHDEGFEYRSERFNEDLGIGSTEDEDWEVDKGFDAMTDRVSVPDSVKFASYVPAPGLMGSYVGFAPLEPEPAG